MRTTVEIQNLKCAGCGNTITNRLNSLKDVSDVSVDMEKDTVSFSHTMVATFDLVRKTLSKLGYPLIDDTNSLVRKAKSYVSCAIGKMGK